jgi:hypothetical protein
MDAMQTRWRAFIYPRWHNVQQSGREANCSGVSRCLGDMFSVGDEVGFSFTACAGRWALALSSARAPAPKQ